MSIARYAVPAGCLLAGTAAVVTAAIVLTGDRHGPTPAAAAIPTVDRGRLPVSRPPGTRVTMPVVRGRFVPGTVLRLPRLGIDARVVAVRAPGDVMQVPRDPRVLGWWRGGAAPGDSTGTTVVVGHVNYDGVAGALGSLPDVRPGDGVRLVSTGRVLRYRVVAVRTYPKSRGIPAAVFRRDGPARLVLITCGGPFDATTGNYEDNIVGYAVPA